MFLTSRTFKEIDNCAFKNALVIGAGGVSPSVILSLYKSGIKNISITNRTSEKCIFLKKFNNLSILQWGNLENEIKKFDIIVNATSLGLKNGNDFNFNFSDTKRDVIYIDTIYNPLETKTYKFLKMKEKKFLTVLICLFIKGKNLFTYGIRLTQKLIPA